MADQKKEGTTVPDNASHNPPATGKMSPGAGHSRTPTEDNEKDVVKKKDIKDVRG
jgi:hypothetical protein